MLPLSDCGKYRTNVAYTLRDGQAFLCLSGE